MMVDQYLVLDGTLTSTADGAVDAYNVPTETTTTTAVKCWVMQANATESTRDANQQAEDVVVYLPAGTAVTGRDRITIDGATFEFQGPPWSAANPLYGGAVSFVQASARRVA